MQCVVFRFPLVYINSYHLQWREKIRITWKHRQKFEGRCLFYCLRGPQNKACILCTEKNGWWKRKPKLYQLYLPFYYLLFTYYFIYLLPKNTQVDRSGLIKKDHSFLYSMAQRNFHRLWRHKGAIIRLNVNILMMSMPFFFRIFWNYS